MALKDTEENTINWPGYPPTNILSLPGEISDVYT